VSAIKVRELLQLPFWGPKEYAKITGQSIPTARKQLNKIQAELKAKGFNNLSNSKVAVSEVIKRINLDLDFLERTGALERDLA
jgi:hypothetical protein